MSSGHDIELEDMPADPEPNINEEFAEAVKRANGPEIPADASKSGPWNLLLRRVLPQNLMKEPTVKTWIDHCEEPVQELLGTPEKRKDIISFVETSLEKLGAHPQHFIFFIAKPKHMEDVTRAIIIIEKGNKMTIIRGNQKLKLSGVITYFFPKTNSNFQFGFSTGLFIKFQLIRGSTPLVSMINDFMKNEISVCPIVLTYQCFRECAAMLPTHFGIRDYIFSQLMSPSLETVLKWELHDWENTTVLRHAAQSIFILFAKAHILGYFIRILLPLYLTGLEDYSQFLDKKTLIGFLLYESLRLSGREFYHELRGAVKLHLKTQNDPNHYIACFFELLIRAPWPPLVLFLAKMIWNVGRKLYGTNIDAVFFIVSKYLVVYPARLCEGERADEEVELAKKYSLIEKIVRFEDHHTIHPEWTLSYKRILAKLVESPPRTMQRETGLSPDMASAAFDNLCAVFTSHAENLIRIQEDTPFPEHWVDPITVTMNDIFKEIDKKKSPVPHMSVLVQLSMKQRKIWLRKRGLEERQVPGIVVPLSEVAPRKPKKPRVSDASALPPGTRVRRRRKVRDEGMTSDGLSSVAFSLESDAREGSSALVSETGGARHRRMRRSSD